MGETKTSKVQERKVRGRADQGGLAGRGARSEAPPRYGIDFVDDGLPRFGGGEATTPATAPWLAPTAWEARATAQQVEDTTPGDLPTQQDAGGWWQRKVSRHYDELKEKAYAALIEAVRAKKDEAFAAARAEIESLPPSLRGAATVYVDASEAAFDVATSAVYAIIGFAVGFGEGIVDVVKGLVRLLYVVADLLAKLIAGFFSSAARQAFGESAYELADAIKTMPVALKQLFDDWVARFQKAPPERQSLMIGELTGQVIAMLATLNVGAGAAASAPKLSWSMPVVSGPQLALAATAVDVASPAVALTLWGTTVMMTARGRGGSGGGGRGGGGADDFTKVRKEAKRDFAKKPVEPASTLQTLVGEGSRQSFRKAVAQRIAADPKHPLRFLLNERARLETTRRKGLTHDVMLDNTRLVEAGHVVSHKAGGARMILMSAYRNRMISATIEHSSKSKMGSYIEITEALDMGGIAVDVELALDWLNAGNITPEIFQAAKRIAL
jgi:Bacterial toxin 5